MTRTIRRRAHTPERWAAWSRERAHPARERRVADGEFACEAGPLRSYRRSLRSDGVTIVETVRWELDLPFFNWLLRPLFAGALRRHPGGPEHRPGWAPLAVIDRHVSRLFGGVLLLTFVTGYLGTLVTATVTYAAREFGVDVDSTVGSRLQGNALALIRADVLLVLPFVALADRLGRRRLLLWASVLGPLLTATCGLSRGLWQLAVLQLVARAFVTICALLIAVVAVEEMPAGSRGWAASVMVGVAAVGSALAVALSSFADVRPGAWRALYFVPLLALPATRRVAAVVPETRRFRQAAGAAADGAMSGARRVWGRRLTRRLALLASGAFLFNVAVNPSTQFQSEFLRSQRGMSAGTVAVFVLATNAPGALGVLVGGLLADRRGRRRIVAFGIVMHALTNMAMFTSRGAPMWAWSIFGALLSAVALPGWAIYGSELFPTEVRSRVNGALQVAGRAGGALGLFVVGRIGSHGRLGRAIAVVAVAELVTALLVFGWYPETARRELEDVDGHAVPVGTVGADASTISAG